MSPHAAAPSDRLQRRAVRLPGKLRRAVPQHVRRVPPEDVCLLDALQNLVRVPSTARLAHEQSYQTPMSPSRVELSGNMNPLIYMYDLYGVNHFQMPSSRPTSIGEGIPPDSYDHLYDLERCLLDGISVWHDFLRTFFSG